MPTLLLTLDLAGITVFAIRSAAVGIKYRLDLHGRTVEYGQALDGTQVSRKPG